MTEEEYYIAPQQAVFEDIKANAILIWKTYDDTYGYATSKVDRIKNLENIRDNAAYIVAMFDATNQNTLMMMVQDEARLWLMDLLKYARSYV